MNTPPDRDGPASCVDADDETQATQWAQRFGVSVEEVKDAVRAVGTSAEDVEDYLKGGGRRTA